MSERSTSVSVDYKRVEEWHVFTSKDMPGLYVASADAETAYNDVLVAIEKLIELDFGRSCKVAPEISFAEFVQMVHADQGKKKRQPKAVTKTKKEASNARQTPVFNRTQRFAVHACA
jgi:hypothetical protein